MNFILKTKKILIKISLYTVLIQGLSTIFTEQMPTSHIFRKGHSNAGIAVPRVYCLTSKVLGTERQNLK
jgi:hypothetical protein